MYSILSMSSCVSRIANTSSRILRTLEGTLFGLLVVDNVDDGNAKNSIHSWLLLQSWSRIVAMEGNTMLTLFKSGSDDDCDASVLLFSDDSFFWDDILFGRISRGFRLECKKASVWMNNKNLSLGQSYKKKIMRTRRLTFATPLVRLIWSFV